MTETKSTFFGLHFRFRKIARKGYKTERASEKEKYFERFLNSEILRWAQDSNDQTNPVLEGKSINLG